MRNKLWLATTVGVAAMTATDVAWAADPSAVDTVAMHVADKWSEALRHMGAALGIAIAVAGATRGQSRAAAAALEGIARNPGAQTQIFMPMIVSLALMESLAVFALLIAFSVL